VARCKEDILAAKGVKPTLSPNLNVLATVEALDVKRLLFIGVGCQAKCPLMLLLQDLHAGRSCIVADTAMFCVARFRRCAVSKSICSWTSCMCSGYAVQSRLLPSVQML
jgi:coenzyme F420-reducing hydrogenase beta subunit